jgi:hypothetical protein
MSNQTIPLLTAGSTPVIAPLRLVDMGDGTFSLATTTQDQSYSVKAHAYAQVSVTTAAQALTALGVTIPAWATMAFIVPESGALRYRCDGTAPTTSNGMPIAQGQAWPIQGATSLAALQLVAQAGTVSVSIEFRG